MAAESQATAVTMTGFSHLTGLDYAIRINMPERTRTNELPTLRVTEVSNGPSADVSPLRSDDINERDSGVSPVCTQTLDAITSKKDESTMPQVAKEFPALTSTQRMDLPTARTNAPPLAKKPQTAIYDTSMELDMDDVANGTVSDVVVRFSMPRCATGDKPPTQDMPTRSDIMAKEIYELSDTVSPRGSVHSVDPVAPLTIKKYEKAMETQTSAESGDLSSFIRRSFPRRQSVWFNESGELNRNSVDLTDGTKKSSVKAGAGHLPGLREESQEDVSPTGVRVSAFKFPTPQTILAKKTVENDKPVQPPAKAKHRQPIPAAPGMPLSEVANLPSLNFSRMDLVDKLNEALDR